MIRENNYNNYLLIILIFSFGVFSIVNTSAQRTSPILKGNFLEIGIGYQFQRFKDTYHSSIYRNAGGLTFGLTYRSITDKRQHVIGVAFSNPKTNKSFASFVNNIIGGLYYEQLRLVNNNLWLGGYFDLGGFYGFRDGNWGDAASTYTYGAWTSLGLSASMRKSLEGGWSINPSIRLPVIAYTVRPQYALPYPTSFMQDGRFSFIENGMAKELVKSGKLQTVNNFMNLQISCGIHRSFGTRQHQIGIQYHTSYLFFKGERPVADWQNQFSIVSRINFQKP